AALLAQRRVRPGARARRAEDPRRGPRLELRRGAFQPRERSGRAAALLGQQSRRHAVQARRLPAALPRLRIARADDRGRAGVDGRGHAGAIAISLASGQPLSPLTTIRSSVSNSLVNLTSSRLLTLNSPLNG